MNENSRIKKSLILEQQQDKEVSFTELETQCVLQFIKNNTPVSIGVALGLNQKTVQFYLRNAGQKLRLIAKRHLGQQLIACEKETSAG